MFLLDVFNNQSFECLTNIIKLNVARAIFIGIFSDPFALVYESILSSFGNNNNCMALLLDLLVNLLVQSIWPIEFKWILRDEAKVDTIVREGCH